MVDVIYAPILGQSNGGNMNNFVGDDDAGYTMLEDGLSDLTGLTVQSAFIDPNTGDPVDLAVGGSTVDGNNSNLPDHKIWWYPDTDEPGGALLNAVALLQSQRAELESQGDVKTTIIWSQGEHNAEVIGLNTNKTELADRYEEATEAVFDYIIAELGGDIEFYIMQTGNFIAEGALNEGYTPQEVLDIQEGAEMVSDAQTSLAASRSDVHIAANYTDYQTDYETGDPAQNADKWHLSGDSYEVIGTDLAKFIADDMGYSGTLSDPRIIEGTSGNDVLSGSTDDETLTGGDGNDNLRGREADDYILGGDGVDVLRGDEGNDILMGNDGNDRAYGGEGNDALIGGEGNDILRGDSGMDFLKGDAGRDQLRGGGGNDTLDGGAGRDYMEGSAGADTFLFTLTSHSVRSGVQQDSIMDFETGVDIIDLSNLGFTGLATGTASAGELRIIYNSNLDRTYFRDDYGTDFEFYLQGDFSTTISSNDFIFATGGSTSTNIDGTEAADVLTGADTAEDIVALGGDDSINGNAGSDTINGGAGEDEITTGSGADVIRFSSLLDSLDDNGANNNAWDKITDFQVGADVIDLSGLGFTEIDSDGGLTEAGELRIAYSSNSDRTYLRSDQLDFEFYLQGDYSSTLGNDDFIFGIQTDQIVGDNTDELLTGDFMHDAMHGLGGEDTLEGGAGKDVLDGGAGQDVLTGGAGQDIFVFSHTADSVRGPAGDRQYDKITDFELGVDLIDLSALIFTGIVTGSSNAGELRIEYSSNSNRTYVRDDHGSDFEFYLVGDFSSTLTNADFIF